MKIKTKDFLDPRRKFIEDAQKEREGLGNPSNYIVVDPGDDVICDFCNADVIGDPIPEFITIIDNYALCEECAKRQEKKGGGV